MINNVIFLFTFLYAICLNNFYIFGVIYNTYSFLKTSELHIKDIYTVFSMLFTKFFYGCLCAFIAITLALILSYTQFCYLNFTNFNIYQIVGMIYTIPEYSMLYIIRLFFMLYCYSIDYVDEISVFIVMVILQLIQFLFFINSIISRYEKHIIYFLNQGKTTSKIFLIILKDSKIQILKNAILSSVCFVDEISITSLSEHTAICLHDEYELFCNIVSIIQIMIYVIIFSSLFLF